MKFKRQVHSWGGGLAALRRRWFGALLLILGATCALQAQNVVLHLKNGDRLAGALVSEDTNRVVISTSWIKDLAVPIAQIASREIIPPVPPAPKPAVQPAPTVAAQTTNVPTPAVTNSTSVAKSKTPVVAAAPPPSPKPKRWKGEARVGMNYIQGATDQEIYYARLKLTYERPYVANPKHFFRNIFDYSMDYGQTAGVLSANRMDASDKTDFDVGTAKAYVYNLGGVGYDELRKIDLRYEVGPGAGYHLLTLTNLVLNTESGLNYQVENRSDQTRTERFYFRLAEDLTWSPRKQLKFTEKAGFWMNLSLNLTLLDLYDTQPASGVPNNDLQIRSSLGITF
jgi:putative salt-induced outer membrane protein YdiY